MARKAVAIVIPKFGLVGGGERFACRLTAALAASEDWQFHVLANGWDRPEDPRFIYHRIPVIRFPKWLTTISFAHFVNKELNRGQFGLVHAHDRIFAADICTLHSVPHRYWINEIRRKKIPSLFDRVTATVEKRQMADARCRFFLPVSTLAAEEWTSAYPRARARIHVIPPGLDKTSEVEPPDIAAARAAFQLSADDTVMLFVSMNHELKGLEFLLRAMADIRRDEPQSRLKLLVIGKGNEKKYRALAGSLGIAQAVRFGGVQTAMPRIYGLSDFLALPSRFDTFGMVVAEAMAAGLPVLISPHVGARDVVRDGINGFLADPVTDYKGFLKKMTALLGRENRERLARQASRLGDELAWTEIARRYKELYEQILRVP